MANKRNLKSGEKELLSQVFVKTLPFDKIKITDKTGIDDSFYTVPALWPLPHSMLLNTNYHVNVGKYYKVDMSTYNDYSRELLIHECVHVWQGIHGIFKWDYIVNSGVCQIIEGRDAAYTYKKGKDWMWYSAEKQAMIVGDWFKLDGMAVSSDRWRYIRDDLRKHGFGGQSYFFKDAQYLRWTIEKGADDGYPKKTSKLWNSFVKGSSAAFSRIQGENEYYYFFKDDEYIKWKPGSGCLDGYPKKISDKWNSPFIANGVAKVLSPDTNKVYFFKKDEYVRYTFGVGQDSGYPKKISDSWDSPFIKDGFDMCIYWGNGKAYFFKGDQYIRYTLGEGEDSGYPKKIGDVWHSFMRSGLNFGLLKHKDVF